MKLIACIRRLQHVLGAALILASSACQPLWRAPASKSPQHSQQRSGPRLHDIVTLRNRWIVSAEEANDLVEEGAVVLDAHGRTKHAKSVKWQQFSQQKPPHRGKLIDDDVILTKKLQALGISANKPVLVIGRPLKGWGEEGRIVWMLRSLGHRRAYALDGGKDILPVFPKNPVQKGTFQVKRDRRWSITKEEIKAQTESGTIQLIDSRELREFQGNTPYGETRGGHIPEAKHLYFQDLIHPDGTLMNHETLVEKLDSIGIQQDQPIVVYCTGGIRSGWLASVLVSLGYDAKNYPGSMWEWSHSASTDYPLTRLKH